MSIWRTSDLVWHDQCRREGRWAGALLHAYASNRALAVVFACLLLFVGLSELTGLMSNVRFGRRAAWIAGAISGMFGGLVGNQGGIRSAALLAFDADKETFVATATAVGLIVDAARMPVYLVVERSGLYKSGRSSPLPPSASLPAPSSACAHSGRCRSEVFRLVALLLLGLGAWILFGAGE